MARDIPYVGVTLSPQVQPNSAWYKLVNSKSNATAPSAPTPSSLFSNITNRTYSFHTRRGRTYELGRIESGECRVQVNNSDSLFDPNNTSGAFYPNLLPFKPLQVNCAYPITGNILNNTNLSPVGSVNARISVSASDADFELGIVNWYALSGSIGTSGASLIGDQCMRVNASSVAVLDVPVVAGKQITVSMYQQYDYFGGAGCNFKVYDGGYYAGATATTTTNFIDGSQSYTRFTATLTPTSPKITIVINQNDAFSNSEIDAVQVEFGSSASTFTTTGSTIYNLFNGFVERYPQSYQAPNRGEANIVATDAIASMSQVQMANLYQSYLLQDPSEALYYYPLNEPAGSTSASNASLYNQLPLNLQTFVLPSDVVFGDELAVTGVPGAATTGATFFNLNAPSDFPAIGTYLSNTSVQDVSFASSQTYTFNMWLKASGTNNQMYFMCNYSGAANIANQDFSFGIGTNSAGKLCVRVLAYDVIYGDQYLAVQPTALDTTNWHLVSMKVTYAGGNTYDFTLTVDGVVTTGTITNAIAKADVKNFIVGGASATVGLNTIGTSVAHVSIHRGAVTYQDYHATGAYAQYTDSNVAEQTGTRFANTMANYSGFKYLPTFNDLGVSQMQAFTPTGTTVTDYIQNIADTEGGEWYVDGDGYVTFKDRDSRLKKLVPKVTFGDGTGETAYQGGDVVVNYDPTYIFNDIVINRNGGVTVPAQDQTSVANYFPRSYTRTIYNGADAEALDAAYFLLSRYKDPVARVETIVLTPARNPSIWSVALGLEIGDLIRVKKRPLGGAPISLDCFIERVEHNFDAQTADWITTVTLSPVFRYYWNLSGLKVVASSGSGTNSLEVVKGTALANSRDIVAGQLMQGQDNNSGFNCIAVVSGTPTETSTRVTIPLSLIGYLYTSATTVKSSTLSASILMDTTTTCVLANTNLASTSGSYVIDGEIVTGSVSGSTLTITARAQNGTKQTTAGTDNAGAGSYSHLAGATIYYINGTNITPLGEWTEILPNQYTQIPYALDTTNRTAFSTLGSWYNTLNTGSYTTSSGTVKYSGFTVNPLTDVINYPQSDIAVGQILSVVNASNVAESFAVVNVPPPLNNSTWNVYGYKVTKGSQTLSASVGIDATTITTSSAVTASAIVVGGEFMTVTAGSGTTSLTVTRGTPDLTTWGVLGLSPHYQGDAVYVVTNAGCSGTYAVGSAIIEGYNATTVTNGSARLGY